MSKIIELKNVNKWFDKFQALKDVNLEVNQQEKIVICGPSGSGKSTLIRCINRLEEHQEGHIVVDGNEISENTKRYAVTVLKEAQERKESAGKAPMGLAATALYLSCVKNGVSITQRDLAEAAGVTEVTIRNRYKGLKADQAPKPKNSSE